MAWDLSFERGCDLLAWEKNLVTSLDSDWAETEPDIFEKDPRPRPNSTSCQRLRSISPTSSHLSFTILLKPTHPLCVRNGLSLPFSVYVMSIVLQLSELRVLSHKYIHFGGTGEIV